nr:hypothetical protein [Acinetobacter nosocomialis]
MNAVKEPAMSEFKVAVNSESDFNIVMALAESMGYYNGLEFKDIPNVKVLFLPNDSKHISWSYRGIEKYKGRFGKKISIEELKQIAAGHRIDKPSNSGELETLDHEENHISPNCKVEDV